MFNDISQYQALVILWRVAGFLFLGQVSCAAFVMNPSPYYCLFICLKVTSLEEGHCLFRLTYNLIEKLPCIFLFYLIFPKRIVSLLRFIVKLKVDTQHIKEIVSELLPCNNLKVIDELSVYPVIRYFHVKCI